MDVRGDQKLTQAIGNTTGALVSTQLGIFESVSLRGLREAIRNSPARCS